METVENQCKKWKELIQVKSIELEHYEELERIYCLRRPETSDSNLLNLYLWKTCYPTRYFTIEDGVVWVAKEDKNKYYSVIPCCREEKLKEYFYKTECFFNQVLEQKLSMYVVDKQAIDLLNLPEEKYIIERDRNHDDYIYDAQKMMTFSGKKYHKKKNHLNWFKKNYEGRYEFRLLDGSHKEEILTFLRQWMETKEDTEEDKYIAYEAEGIAFLLEHYEELHYKIGGVYIDGTLNAFTIGNYYEQEDMVYIPVEKANGEIRGLYPYICSEFLKQAFPQAAKVNREDDMGLPGLRQAKLSYNPVYMVEKYTIRQK